MGGRHVIENLWHQGASLLRHMVADHNTDAALIGFVAISFGLD